MRIIKHPRTRQQDEIPRGDLLAEYLFDGDYDDTSGNGYDWDDTNISLATGKVGNYCAYFNGSAYAYVANLMGAISTNHSYSLWVKYTATSQVALFGGATATNDCYAKAIWPYQNTGNYPGNFSYFASTADSNYPALQTTTAINDNSWHHVAIVRTPTATSYMYLDGVLNRSASSLTGTTASPNAMVGKYRDYPGYYYTGYLDNFRIYNRALTAAEVSILYNEGA